MMSTGGIECFDSNGNAIFKAQCCTTRIIGRFFTGSKNGSYLVDVPTGYNIWIALCYTKLDNSNLNNPKAGFVFPVIRYENGKIVWEFNTLSGGELINYMGVTRVNVSTEVIYGIY